MNCSLPFQELNENNKLETSDNLNKINTNDNSIFFPFKAEIKLEPCEELNVFENSNNFNIRELGENFSESEKVQQNPNVENISMDAVAQQQLQNKVAYNLVYIKNELDNDFCEPVQFDDNVKIEAEERNDGQDRLPRGEICDTSNTNDYSNVFPLKTQIKLEPCEEFNGFKYSNHNLNIRELDENFSESEKLQQNLDIENMSMEVQQNQNKVGFNSVYIKNELVNDFCEPVQFDDYIKEEAEVQSDSRDGLSSSEESENYLKNEFEIETSNSEKEIFRVTIYEHNTPKKPTKVKTVPVLVKHTPTFRCMFCKSNFISQKTLDLHISTCKAVQKKYTAIKKVIRNNEHNYNTKVIKCCICNAEFSNKIQLHNHVCGKKRENPFTCNVCHRQFSKKTNQINHSKIHKYVVGRELNRD